MATIEHNGYTIVDGVLQLDDLRVEGDLGLQGCTGLTALPDNLSVSECLYLMGCTALTALPDGLSVVGSLDIEDCTALTALPDDLSVGRSIFLSEIWLTSNEAILMDVTLPESIRTAAIGRRLGDLIDHWALSWNGMRDQKIERIREGYDGDLVIRLQPHADVGLTGSEGSTASTLGYD